MLAYTHKCKCYGWPEIIFYFKSFYPKQREIRSIFVSINFFKKAQLKKIVC